MGRIVQLDSHLSNMIAAGEVVERPSSVVKELVENSIDAGATHITVSVLDGGTKEIVVTDDGCGMSAEDALMAFGRHATSKIKSERDLFRISTLGFRGEAVPSIASVSHFTLLTSEGEGGFEVVYSAGKKVSATPSAASKGTVITVKNLFFNTPARLKYLKSIKTELASVSNLMIKFALANPSISFTFKSDGQTVLNTSGMNDLVRLFGEIYGYNIAKNLMISEFKSFGYSLKIAMVKSMINRSNKNEMTLVCNTRYVKSFKISDAMCEAYNTYIPHTRYPICCIYLELDPALVDVNVHPSKAIIKISNEDEIAETVKRMAQENLMKANMIPTIEPIEKPKVYQRQESFITQEFDSKPLMEEEKPYNPVLFNEKEIKVTEEKPLEPIKDDDIYESPNMVKTERLPYLEYVGQVHGTYLIFQNEDGMYVVDQHAAAERINYEKYYNILSHPEVIKTPLLIPYTIEFTKTEMIFVEDNLEALENIGISMNQVSDMTYAVREVPYWMDLDRVDELLHDMVSSFYENKEISIIKQRDRISKQIACKSSIKANHSITQEEALKLIEQLNECNNPYTCPHGRPSIIKMSKLDLEKLFLRVN